MILEIATAVRLRRLQSGLSQQEVSSKLGLSVERLRIIETGEEDVDLLTVCDFADALGVSAESLLLFAEQLGKQRELSQNRMRAHANNLRVLDTLERQHKLMIDQLARLRKQTAMLKESHDLLEPVFHNQVSHPVLKLVDRLDEDELEITARVVSLAKVRKMNEDQERFAIRRFPKLRQALESQSGEINPHR